MYTLHCTKKLLDRMKGRVDTRQHVPSTRLGNWYATALFWKPQVALLVNERSLLPVLMPLAPAASLPERFAEALAAVLQRHGQSQLMIDDERTAMNELCVMKTTNRSVVGTMNEFAFLADVYRGQTASPDLVALSLRLAGTPCGAIKYESPARMLAAIAAGGGRGLQ
jgi:hypothetical protein